MFPSFDLPHAQALVAQAYDPSCKMTIGEWLKKGTLSYDDFTHFLLN